MKSKSAANSLLTIETPEGVELALPIADPVLRGYAYVIDFAIRALFIYLLFFLGMVVFGFSSGSRAFSGLFLVILFLLYWGYYVLFEVLYDGASPGKKLMGLKVVHDDLTPITFTSSVTRNLLRVVDWLPFFCGVGIVSVLFSKDNKRIGDYVAKTVVICSEKRLKKSKLVKRIEEKAAPPLLALTMEEQRAVINFARFAEAKSEDRAKEIVANVAPLFKEEDPQALIKKLKQHAKWYLGES